MKNQKLLQGRSMHNRMLRLVLTVIMILSCCSLQSYGQLTPKSFSVASMSNIKGYYEYLPAGYTYGSGKKYPLILFFHGAGELANTGTPLSGVLRNGLPNYISQNQFPTSFTVNNQQYSFIVIAPQFYSWPGAADAIKFKDYLLSRYDIDTNRIYLTGLSMGGGETWGAISENPSAAKAFAAAVVVCGYYKPDITLANNIAADNTPVWALHNKVDPNADPQFSIDWVKMINNRTPVPNPAAKLTIFNASGHDAWTQAYNPTYRENGMNVYEWMLQYTKGGGGAPQPTAGKRITVPVTNSANGRAEMYYPDAMKTLGVNPGDTLCIPAGEYEYIHLGNLLGTAAKPIVITNCGGQVKLGVRNQGTAAVFNAATCRFIEISGSGDPNYEYGFDLNGTNITGLKIFGIVLGSGSSDFDVHHLYIHDGGILLQAKTLQTCAAPQYLEGNFVMKNVKIHNIKARNSAWEGFYIGNTHYYWTEGTCTDMRSHWIENLWVYDNDLENIGSDGIQIAMAKNGDNRVFNNRLVNYATAKNSAHGYGILLGSGSAMKVYNNYISGGYMPGVTVFGSGVSEVYNNVISDIFYEGINVSDKIPDNTTYAQFPPPAAIIYNNTIVNADSNKNAIKIFAYLTPIGHQVYNNLLIEKGTAFDYPDKGMYIKGDKPILLTASNNICIPGKDTAGFVNAAAHDFHLVATSRAVNSGRDMSGFSLATDYDYTPRPQQGKYDVGAFEYKDVTTPLPPIANAGSDVTITLPVSDVLLDGSASRAQSGTLKTYSWKKISGPAGDNILTPLAAKTSVTGLVAGTYIYELTVTDSQNATASDRVTVTVNPAANKPPVANAGTNINIQLPVNSVQLDGSASTDPDGTIAKWNWGKVSGPAGESIGTPSSSKTAVTGLVAGIYVFELTVTDDKNATSSARVTVTVAAAGNKPPVANAGANINVQLPVSNVQLDGSASADPDGTITKWSWSKVSGPAGESIGTPSSAMTAVTGLVAGTYVFELTVTDDKNATASARVTVTVTVAGNKPPVANAGANINIQLPVSSVQLDGSASADPDGTITKWSWSKVSGPAGESIGTPLSATTAVTGLVAGTYVFELTVTDDKNATASARVTVTVNPAANKPPVANAGTNVSIQLPVSSVQLYGSASADPDGTITGWSWSKVSGPAGESIGTPSSATTAVTGLVVGTYVFELTVTDDKNATSSARVTVTVTDAPGENRPPVAVVHADNTVQLPTTFLSADGGGSYDTDGNIRQYQWTQLSGPAQAFIATPGGARTLITRLQEGSYSFRLTVTDDKQATGSVVFNVTVLRTLIHNGDSISLAPNPVRTSARLTVVRDGNQTINVRIYDVHGKPCYDTKYSFSNMLQADIDVSRFPNGLYFMEITGEDLHWIRRFVKVGG
ncbi:MAG TPA: PKD domain-containing protein [Chitinophaga sp.]|uniref:PKD domain-containing protein n=1 Tax=Chitinophaga sp. TaxID=1869181 RepID=UPI002C168623|nr:PKD domain-containing protein [Chitinophaga sp.]HVI47674.1 PKD domain-containing protein [Chitinophaga sp.]